MSARRKTIVTVLAGLVLVVVLVCGGLWSILRFRPSALIPVVEQVASRVLQRDFRVGELVEVRLGRDAYLVARNLALANPSRVEPADMARIQQLSLGVHLPSLWRDGPLLVREIGVSGLQLDLQAPADRPANWELTAGEDEDEAEYAPDEVALPLIVERADIQRALIRYRDADRDIEASLDTLQLAVRPGDTFTHLEISGEVNTMPLEVSGMIGPATALQNGRQLALDLQGRLDRLQLAVAGNIADLQALTGIDLDIQVEAPRSRPLLDLLGLQEVRDGPLSFAGRLAGGEAGLDVTAKGALADFDLQVNGSIETPATLDGIDLHLIFNGPSMAEAGVLLGMTGLRDVPYQLSGNFYRRGTLLRVQDGRLHADQGQVAFSVELPDFPEIQNARASIEGRRLDLSVLGPVIGVDGLPAALVDIDGGIVDGSEGAELVDMRVAGGGMDLVLQGSIGEAPDYLDSTLQARFTIQDVSTLETLLGLDGLPKEAFELTGSLSAHQGGWRLEQALLTSRTLRLEVEGELDRLIDPQHVQGRARFRTGDLFTVLSTFGVEASTEELVELEIGAGFHRTDVGIEVTDLEGRIGELGFTGSGLVSDADGLEGSRVALKTGGADLARSIEPLSAMPVPPEPFSVDLEAIYTASLLSIERFRAAVGQHRLNAVLTLKEGSGSPPAVSGRVRLEGASLGDLLAQLGLEAEFGQDDYQLSANLEANRSALVLDQLRFDGGGSDIEGRVAMRFGDVPNIDARLRSDKLRLPFTRPQSVQSDSRPDQPHPNEGGGSPDITTPPGKAQLEQRVIPDTPLPLDWMHTFEGALRYEVAKAYLGEDIEAQVAIDLILEGGVLASRKLEWHGPVSEGSAALTVDGRPDDHQFHLHLASSRLPLVWFFAGHGPPTFQALYRAELKAQGNTVRQLASSLDGGLLFKGKGIRVNNQGLDLVLGATLTSIVDRMNPFTETVPYTELECHAGAIAFNQGVMEIVPGVAIRGDKVDMAVVGVLDLHDESLGITLRSRARKGLGISAGKLVTPYLKLAGNLAHPYLSVDPEAVVTTGGAAIATAGLAILAENLYGRWKAAREDPCEQIFIQAANDPERAFRSFFPDVLQEFRR